MRSRRGDEKEMPRFFSSSIQSEAVSRCRFLAVTDPAITRYEPGAIVTPPKDGGNNPLPFILLSDVTNDPVRVGLSARPVVGVDHIRSGTLMLSIEWPIARATNIPLSRVPRLGTSIQPSGSTLSPAPKCPAAAFRE